MTRMHSGFMALLLASGLGLGSTAYAQDDTQNTGAQAAGRTGRQNDRQDLRHDRQDLRGDRQDRRQDRRDLRQDRHDRPRPHHG